MSARHARSFRSCRVSSRKHHGHDRVVFRGPASGPVQLVVGYGLWPSSRSPSEIQLQCELNLSHGGSGPSNLAEVPRGCGVRAVTPAGAGTGQYHMVGSVKHLGTELEVHLLLYGEMLEDRKVLCAAPRVSQVVART